MCFTHEADFEEALIKILKDNGWESEVINCPDEKDLIQNWANILFDNNRCIDRLNDYPLTNTEMQQIIDQITELSTPLKLNSFINGKTISIKRDNPDDKLHCGKEISLKIYDRQEIAAGQSRYQIVQQPRFSTKSEILNDRRGDLMLLINGMPVVHIELKRSSVDVSEAYHQIEKYAGEGVFRGIFSLVQVFVAMNPEETVYFANPGPDYFPFNPDYYFHWADFNNEPMNKWKDVATNLLSIPMAHQLIGFYTVADGSDSILKVMRSYQYYAASVISDKVSKTKWNRGEQLGGFIWHTTGSGKTMTSFKSAQLIANSNDADKVVFLTDRIELGTQSLQEYRHFADENESIQATENTYVLISKLKSNAPSDVLIVTSIQKMSNIKSEDDGLNADDIKIINSKRIVFIVDEAHRSTFGEMLMTIKDTFLNAIFFGFTGTPIHDENKKKGSKTLDVFGSELHRYSIADGIRDKNVLGFDPYKVLTYRDMDIRKAVALREINTETEEEAINDPKKSKEYYKFLNSKQIPMAGYFDKNEKYVKGIEDYLADYIKDAQYKTDEHHSKVVEDICNNWQTLSRSSKFHALFATSSIDEAIKYYRLLKEKMPSLRTTCLFDPTIDNNGGVAFKENGLVEIISDYNKRYQQNFTIANHAAFKKDIASRLAHKEPYTKIELTPNEQLDLLIVVDQMLTGFDSKWLNTLYLDKVLRYENIIQAFSRTNRLFNHEKPFGIIRYYRFPHTMEQNIKAAVKLYSGDKPLELFVSKLPSNLKIMNDIYAQIAELFIQAGIPNFEKLPEEPAVYSKFASLFNDFDLRLESAKIQGFRWDETDYTFTDEITGEVSNVSLSLDEPQYKILVQRYKELEKKASSTNDKNNSKCHFPFKIVGHITEIDTGAIDAEYMNSRFEKFLKLLHQDDSTEEVINQAKSELHKTFASLNQEEQKFANIFLHDIQRGDVVAEEGKTLRDYITEYRSKAKNDQISNFAFAFGLDEDLLRKMISSKYNESNIREYGYYDKLYETCDKMKAKAYFETTEGKTIKQPIVNMKMDGLLTNFILQGGFELDTPSESEPENK